MVKEAFHEQPTLPHIPDIPQLLEEIPSQIGPYKIESLLSRGGMSLLYLGLHPEKRIPIAVKVLKSQYLGHPEMKGQFLKEAEVIEMTDHPNIVKLYGHGQWEGGLYIGMEWIKGISLKQFIIQQSLSLKRSMEVVLQVCYSLLHLHTHGVIHRDLKPENILITESGQVKVIDFGISQMLWQPGEAPPRGLGGVIGTPSYMSPEQRKDPLHVDVRADIYSLGVIAYELIVGRLSFGNVQLELVPKHLRPIIKKALEPVKENRFADIVDLISALSGYLRSGHLQTERRGSDEIKEVYEKLSAIHTEIVPDKAPEWAIIDMGIARTQGAAPLGLYQDFFKLPNNQMVIFLARAPSNAIEALITVAHFKGLVRMLMHEKQKFADAPFDLAETVATLNTTFSGKSLDKTLHLHALHLNPSEDQLIAVSCGFEPMWSLERGSDIPRLLESRNSALGTDRNASFSSVSDNWEDGDTILLHTLGPDIVDIQTLFSDHRDLSPKPQAEAIVKDLKAQDIAGIGKPIQAVITLQRIP
ncbi:MAG: protein kinase [Chlamydiia bacterium]|nr:protein kinase [Chlamydiia bacterium]